MSDLTNPLWRLENLYTVIDKNAQKLRFRPNPIQARINASQSKRKLILKARQFGVSTNELIKQFDFTIFNRNITACILAHEKDGIEKLFEIVRRTYDNMDQDLCPRPELDRGGGSKYELKFPDIGSKIYCDLESRGDTIHWLHISEAAFVQDENRIKATLETVPLNGRVTFESTPNGIGNHFYDRWNDPNPTYEKMFFPWYLFPDYRIEPGVTDLTTLEREFVARVKLMWGIEITPEQMAFRRMKQSDLKHLFIQEYPEDDQTCFLASGNAAMDLMLIKELMDALRPPLESDDTFKLYEKPYAEGFYVIGADVAEGVRSDYSVGVAIDCKTLRQVAQIRSNQWSPAQFAHELAELGKRFSVRGRPPEIAVERNNHGHACILALDSIEHWPNIFEDRDERLGWLTDKVSRPLMLDRFRDAVENRRYIVRDRDTLAECLTLVDNDGKIEADVGKHDDCVIGHSIALSRALEQAGVSALYENIGAKILVA